MKTEKKDNPKANKQLTTEQILCADNLSRCWYRRQSEWKGTNKYFTQDIAADAIGKSQSVLGQYLNKHIALNVDIILRFAKFLEIHPVSIDPNFNKEYGQVFTIKEDTGEYAVTPDTSKEDWGKKLPPRIKTSISFLMEPPENMNKVAADITKMICTLADFKKSKSINDKTKQDNQVDNHK